MLARLTTCGHDVDDTRGETGLVDELGEVHTRERRLGSRLEHDRRARRERRGELEHDDEQRDVPRDDAGADAHTFLANEHRPEHARAHRLEFERAGQVDVVVEHHRRSADLAEVAEQDRRPDLGGDQLGELVGVGVDQVEESLHRVGALAGGHLRPRAVVERVAGGSDRRVHVGLEPLGSAGEQLPRGRADDLEDVGRAGLHPLATDVELVVAGDINHGNPRGATRPSAVSI